MRKLFGVDLDAKVEPLFEAATPGRVLIMDGDGPVYSSCSTVKKLNTAYNRFLTMVKTEMLLTGSVAARVHLTASSNLKCHRDKYPTVKLYQGNRLNGKKKKPPLLEPLRNFLSQPLDLPEDIEIFMHYNQEADDHIIADALGFGENGLVWSEDKDLRLTTGPYWERELGIVDTIPDTFGYIKESATDGGNFKCIGHGRKFFWWQMLGGDSADDVRGLLKLNGKQCGEITAYKYLADFTDESEAANEVLWQYAEINQDALAEAQCLWLRRSYDDCAYKYLMSLDLDSELVHWLNGLHKHHQNILKEVMCED